MVLATRALGADARRLPHSVLPAGSFVGETPGTITVAYLYAGATGTSPVAGSASLEEVGAVLTAFLRAANVSAEPRMPVSDDLLRVVGPDAQLFQKEPGLGQALATIARGIASRKGNAAPLQWRVEESPTKRDPVKRETRQDREERLEQRARSMADAVLQDGCTRELRALNSYERRIVHVTLETISGIQTRSVGEGQDRHVLIERSS